ncbi:hypothetical protein PRIPAC_86346 [Pristionchus pacificus]|uniref:Uncharacterized protein n=1 Tax=Pristionchus pacificus TaxID=54126 RepID=A0A2A6BLJ8_PRIPA|nr:hypothetical protein PRIPAC_86346 [Pristionchus pacificus]|eukprot:PDM66785.1 hypothetical protein PRIPAC_48202 [Pristionchus pacificus]
MESDGENGGQREEKEIHRRFFSRPREERNEVDRCVCKNFGDVGGYLETSLNVDLTKTDWTTTLKECKEC